MPRLSSLRNSDYSDRELLMLIVDLRDERGVCTSTQIAEALDPDAKHPTQCVGIRLGWMRRYGVVEYVQQNGHPAGWCLTSSGERMAHAGLKGTARRLLESLPPEQGAEAAMMLGDLYRRLGYTESIMLRRGWQHASGRR